MTPMSLPPGHYTPESLPGVRDPADPSFCLIDVSTSGVTLDLSGAVLDGRGYQGAGIWVHDCADVTIRGAVVLGFQYGIQVTRCTGVVVQDCVVSGAGAREDVGWLPDSDDPSLEGFGAGIYLYRVSSSIIGNNHAGNNFDGIRLVRSRHVFVGTNHASHCPNVGIYLLESSHNHVVNNQAEHCIRYTDRFWCDTADSAGILLDRHSDHNQIINNRLRYSGDGLFIRGNRRHSSDHNFVKDNDASYSPNNGFEATFSNGNVFEANIANCCNYGFWLGYSSNTTVAENEVRHSRFDGIAIDRGRSNHIRDNQVEDARHCINLWGEPWLRPDLANETGPGTSVLSGNRVSQGRESDVHIAPEVPISMDHSPTPDNQGDS